MVDCAKCQKELLALPFTCRYCGAQFCPDHRLPENHECKGLERWKRGELKGFKKEIKGKEYTSADILKKSESGEMPSWIKDENTLYIIVAVMVILILAYLFFR
jgi:hypothetical protein